MYQELLDTMVDEDPQQTRAGIIRTALEEYAERQNKTWQALRCCSQPPVPARSMGLQSSPVGRQRALDQHRYELGAY